MALDRIKNNFEYQDKRWAEKLCDGLLTPLRVALGGKKIVCLDLHSGKLIGRAAKEGINLEFRQSRSNRGIKDGLVRCAAGIMAIALLPLTIAAVVGKQYSSNNRPLLERYITHKSTDKYTLEDRMASNLWCKIVEAIAKTFEYDAIISRRSIFKADAQMGGFTRSKISDLRGHSKTSRRPFFYECKNAQHKTGKIY